jgi:hypothetical protein
MHPAHNMPHLVKADLDKIVHNITIELSNAGLLPVTAAEGPAKDFTNELPSAVETTQRYTTRSCRCVVKNQPYNNYAPRTQFLRLGKVRVHRSAFGVVKEWRLDVLGGDSRIIHATTATEIKINTREHTINPDLTTDSKVEVAIW